ncbi:MAG TPA: porin family protein [Saprospiraceae bacterium]|nr:porin family protein [Saprospiraceae bacterium]HPN67955.1 porin family protein [Saprospiraceae bacterium]
MYKLIVFLAIGTFLSSTLIGQDDERNNFQFGIKIGTNYANVYDGAGDDFRADGKFGFVGGVFMAVPIVNVLGFQPEILFSQKGFKGEGTLLGSAYKLTRTTDYIDVPLYLSVKPMEVLTILAGPQVSYLRKRKDVLENDIQNLEQIEEFENENLRKNIFGVAVGVNINLNKLVIGTRAAWDLTTNNGDGTSQTPRYKNAWVQATLGYRFL